ncbi:aldehyde dehydrogenase [Corynebacterium flavescens]
MSLTLTLAGSVASGLTYFSWIGAAAIARSLSEGDVEMSWSQDALPQARLHCADLSLDDIASEVKRLATEWASGWTAVTVQYSAGEFSPFSPRFKAIDPIKHPADWNLHQQARLAQLDKLAEEGDHLALNLIQALGEAAYWRFDRGAPRPDHGASRWEMKTRNRGEEFIRHRLHPMCVDISEWSLTDIAMGLTGELQQDTIGNVKEGSRTSSGFQPPSPADTALSFVALIGISSFPVLHRLSKVSVTPGAYPDHVLHPTAAVLPVPVLPITPERFENIVISKYWADLVSELGPETSILNSPADHEHFKELGIPAAALYRIRLAGSASAPERYFEEGKVVVLS